MVGWATVLDAIGGFPSLRQALPERAQVAQMGTSETAVRHPLGTAPPRSIAQQNLRADSQSALGEFDPRDPHCFSPRINVCGW
jgi:hypothetical protein